MAATDDTPSGIGWLTAAALALPGLMPAAAQAEEAPEQGTLALKFLHYDDSQTVRTRYPYYDGSEPGSFKRITVNSPSAQLVLPVTRHWSLQAGAVVDEVSGASPRYYSDVSGASRMQERRTAFDAQVSRHFERAGVTLGAAQSKENDYRSQALSAEGRWASEDQNTAASVGLGTSRDTITPVKGGVLGVERDTRRTTELQVGLTRAVSRDDLAQISLGYSRGAGYFSDPYKQFDQRPRERDTSVVLARWNHHVGPLGATLRSSYRWYSDSFGIRAHTLEAQWVQPLAEGWKLTPALRYYTQSAASFYHDPVTDLSVYPGTPVPTEYSTVDQRMSAFGALTLGLKAEYGWRDWTFDLRYDRYEQRSGWRLGGPGSPGLDPLHANIVQVGVSARF